MSPSNTGGKPTTTESTLERITRCYQGIQYDCAHWDELPCDGVTNKTKYILLRDDRVPVTVGTLLITCIVIWLLLPSSPRDVCCRCQCGEQRGC